MNRTQIQIYHKPMEFKSTVLATDFFSSTAMAFSNACRWTIFLHSWYLRLASLSLGLNFVTYSKTMFCTVNDFINNTTICLEIFSVQIHEKLAKIHKLYPSSICLYDFPWFLYIHQSIKKFFLEVEGLNWHNY